MAQYNFEEYLTIRYFRFFFRNKNSDLKNEKQQIFGKLRKVLLILFQENTYLF